ncbi:hypothetical protein ILUMI_14312 [Ignelater luminosus]|uniref:CLIP domain-containing serine protease n=1 Tax=Ignelater luminosus TaxID=2038154 RepID=A0A8K0CUH7_IGNLU|nr:hypothetical protein ILUMI_14312 [Ignelater luminosus]
MLKLSVIVLLSLSPLISCYAALNQQQVNPESLQPKFATPCTTPNLQWGACIEIQRCGILMNSLTNGRTDNHDFIRASRCGPPNEDPAQPKVCCGEHDNYLNKLTPVPTTNRPKKKNNNPLPRNCGNQTIVLPSRIFGGGKTSIGEFPWMARLLHRRPDGVITFGCAGFLIANQFVLTAAHCIRSKALAPLGPVFKVQLGEHDTYTLLDCEGSLQNRRCAHPPQMLRAANPIVHPEYTDTIQQHNDIALIPLKDPATFTEFVYPICLAKAETQETEMWLSGWGKTETQESSHIKLKVIVHRVNRDQCGSIYRNAGTTVLPTQLCAGGEEGLDSCSGDSGGPIMVQSGTGPWQAEGIVSYGMGCGLEGWPGIYTNIPEYLPWIKRKMNQYLRKQQRNNPVKTSNIKH